MLLKLNFGFLLFVLLFSSLLIHGQSEQAVVSAFKKLKEEPAVITIANSLEVNNSGGHIQGIQLLSFQNEKYALVTGSSDSYSYYSVMKSGERKKLFR